MNSHFFPRAFAALALLAFFLNCETTGAANRWWDGGTGNISTNGDGVSFGGAGTWDTTTQNWDQGSGLAHVAWVNANNDSAIFAGTAGTVTLGAGITVNALTFNTNGYTITGNTLTFAGATPTITANTNAAISSVIAGTAGLTKAGSGALTLSGGNTFTGGWTINSGPAAVYNSYTGALIPSAPAALGPGAITFGAVSCNGLYLNGTMTVTNNIAFPNSANTIFFIGGGNGTVETYGGVLSGGNAGFILGFSGNVSGASTVTELTNAANTFRGEIDMERGVLAITSAGALGNTNNLLYMDQGSSVAQFRFDANNINVPQSISQVETFYYNVNGNNATLSGTITGGSSSYSFGVIGGTLAGGNSAGTLTISGSNTGTAAYSIAANTKLIAVSANALGTGAKTVSSGGTIAFNNIGTYTGSGPITINGTGCQVGGVGGGALENISGNNIFNNSITNASAASIGVDAGSLTLGGNISGAFGLTKIGAGTLVLNAADTYTGLTAVNAGTLQVNYPPASTALAVAANAGLTLGALWTNASTAFGVSGTDPVTLTCVANGSAIAGQLFITGANNFTNNAVVTVNITGSLPAAPCTNTLITYAGSIKGTGSFVLGPLPYRAVGYLVTNASIPAIQLVITALDSDIWVGSPTNNWDLSGSNIWQLASSGLPTAFQNTDQVVFNDNATNFSVNVAAAVSPSGVTFSNNAVSYTLAGSGKISGGTGLILQGMGTVTLGTTNDYTGATTINAGKLVLGAPAAIPSSSSTAVNGTLDVAGFSPTIASLSGSGTVDNVSAGGAPILTVVNSTASTFAGVIQNTSGLLGLTKTGAGTLSLNGANTYTGGTVISSGTLQVGTGGASGTLGTSPVLDNATLAFNRSDSFGLANDILGTGGIQQNGSGTTALSGNLTYTGPTAVNAGTLVFQNNATLDASAGAVLTIAANALVLSANTLNLNVNASSTAVDVTGAGLLQLTSIINAEDKLPDIFFGPNHSGTADYSARLAAPLNLGSSPRTVYGLSGRNDVARYLLTGSDCQFAGSISGTNALTLCGQNNWSGVNIMEVPFAFNASNSFSGPLIIQRGSVYLGNANAMTSGNQLIFAPAANVNSRLFLYGFNASVSDLQSSGLGGVLIADGNNVTTTNVGPATLTVTQNNPFTFGGVICDWFTEYAAPLTGSFTPVLSLVKNGSAALMLAGTNTYSGTTTINAGKLYFNNPSTGGGAVTVNTNATLGGNSFIASTVTVKSGGAIEAGSGNGSGNLILKALTLGSASGDTSVLNLAFTAILNVTNSGGLVVNSGAGSVTVNVSGTIFSTGLYPLVNYAGTIGGTGFSAFQLGALPSGVLGYLTNNIAQSSIELVVTRVTVPRWSGALSAEWSTNSLSAPKNWVLDSDGVTPVDYGDGENIRFTDSATSTLVYLSIANVAPASIVFSNATKIYSISGNFGISGATGLVKQGNGKLTLGTTNNYSGNTTISAGTLALGAATAIPSGAGAGNVIVNGTLDVAGFSASVNNLSGSGTVDNVSAGGSPVLTVIEITNTTFSGAMQNSSGALALNKIGSGTLTLTGSNTFSGVTTVSAGTLTLSGSLAGAVAVQSGAALSGTGVITGNSALADGAALNLIANSPLTLGGLTLNGSVSVNVSGNVSTTNSGTYLLLNHSVRSGAGSFVLTPVASLLAAGFCATLSDTNNQLLLVVKPATVTGTIRDVRHVVIFMQENRSFDEYFGTLHGVRGFSDRNPLMFTNGNSDLYQPSGSSYELPFHSTVHCITDLAHDWTSTHQGYNSGKWNQWVPAKGAETMAYYTRSDLPYYYALADAYTICDEYHCSTLTSTDPNRLYLWTGMIDPTDTGGGPVIDNTEPTPGWRWTTYPERLQNAGVSWKIYQQADNYDDNALAWFASFQGLSAGNPLYDRGIAVANNLVTSFQSDVANGTLPSVSWIIAPTASSEHPPYSVESGEALTKQLLDALASNPQAYNSTVFILLYDENDGFYDHGVPIVPPAATADEFVGSNPIGLGVRVPMIIVSPWSRGGYACSQVFDATSVLRFLENWTGVKEPNISAWRRQVCGDLTSAFDFAHPNTNYPSLTAVTAVSCSSGTTPSVPSPQTVPAQEAGTLLARPLPYQPNTASASDCGAGKFYIALTNSGAASAHFSIYANAYRADGPWQFDVANGGATNVPFSVAANAGNYDFTCYGPNGFVRRFAGNVNANCNAIEITPYLNPGNSGIKLALANATASAVTFNLTNNYFTNGFAVSVPAGSTNIVEFLTLTNNGWYDMTATMNGGGNFLRKFAGHIETNGLTNALLSSENASGFRDNVIFTSTVTGYGTPTGTVQFKTNGVALGSPVTLNNGLAVFNTATLPRGNNLVTAEYSGDLLNAPVTNSLTQTVTNHPPVAGSATYPRLSGYALQLKITSLLTNDTDADGDTINFAGTSATTTNGLALTSDATNIYVPTNTVPDAFTYIIQDGNGGTNSGSVFINIITNAFGAGSPSISLPAGGSPQLTFAAIPGYNYTLQISTDLNFWTDVWTNNAPTNGLFQFQHTNSPQPAAFYRLRYNLNP